MELYANISRIVAKKILGNPLTDEEERMLSEWLLNEANQATFDEIKSLKQANLLLKLEEEHYGEKMAQQFVKQQRKASRRFFIRKYGEWLSGAAVVAAFILTILFFFFASERFEQLQITQSDKHLIMPGAVKATLTLANGLEFNIDQDQSAGLESFIDSVNVHTNKNVPADSTRMVYNKLSVPKGGEFFYQLADGTKIWLNSDSELRFPETFTSSERKIYIKGEAFLEVAKNEKSPFVVSTMRGDIRVYGTRFNVTDYPEQPLSTVLVEGSIGFKTLQGEDVRLQPSQRLCYDATNNKVEVETVDVSVYTAWIDHNFIFKAQTLESIMRTLSRWYNFNIIFMDDDLRNIRLSGRLYRYDDVEVLLDCYEQTANIKFTIKDNSIIVSK